MFGVHVCLTVGLPEEVAHIAVGHSFKGQYMGVSAECTIIRQADHGWWHLAGALGLVTPETVAAPSTNLRALAVARLLRRRPETRRRRRGVDDDGRIARQQEALPQ